MIKKSDSMYNVDFVVSVLTWKWKVFLPTFQLFVLCNRQATTDPHYLMEAYTQYLLNRLVSSSDLIAKYSWFDCDRNNNTRDFI